MAKGTMLSEHQQKRVWEGLLSAEIRANYFAELSGRYRREQRFTTWAIVLLSSGAVATFVYAGLPARFAAWLRPALAVLTAAGSLYLLVARNHERAIDSASLHERWNRMAGKYETLWENVYAEDAQERLRQFDEECAELSTAATGFPYKKRTMLKWQDHVEQHHAIHAA